jgi:hypothetical protein
MAPAQSSLPLSFNFGNYGDFGNFGNAASVRFLQNRHIPFVGGDLGKKPP